MRRFIPRAVRLALGFAVLSIGLAFSLRGNEGRVSTAPAGTHKVFNKPKLESNPERQGIVEPYPYLSGGSFIGPDNPLSPDPLVSFQWDRVSGLDGLQVYAVRPVFVTTDSPVSFQNLESLTGEGGSATVVGPGSIRLDFGVESAAWLEMESPDLDGDIEMSISEYNEPAVVNIFTENPVKTRKPVKHGSIYRLELNSLLYEGVRFGWVHVKSLTRPWSIRNIRLVCQVKPVNYRGRFYCNDPLLTQIWYTGAYSVKLNLQRDYFGAILMDRGDRHSWTGDAYPAQAAALVAFGNLESIKANLERTSGDDNGIESYALYWILSMVDYYMYSGDSQTFGRYIAVMEARLDHAYLICDDPPSLVFYGWDERLGAGFENPDCEEARRSYRMLYWRACLEYARAAELYGRPDLGERHSARALEGMANLRSNEEWLRDYGLHAAAEAVNTGLLNEKELRDLPEREYTNPIHRISYSPFNQYFIIQSLARLNKHKEAVESIRECWGGQIGYGGTAFFEVFRPDWYTVLPENDPVPNNQCGYTSLAHAWGAGVTKWLTEEVLGVKPLAPGFSEYEIRPNLCAGVNKVEGTVPTPFGEIRAAFDFPGRKCVIEAPPGTKGRVVIPTQGRPISAILVNGETVWTGRFHSISGLGEAEVDEEFIFFRQVDPGRYEFTFFYGEAPSVRPDAPPEYAAMFLGVDERTRGNWGGVYGEDGYILFNFNEVHADERALPSYVRFIATGKSNDLQWEEDSLDPRALSPDRSNSYPRRIGCLHTGDPFPTHQTMTVDIGISEEREVLFALYFVDWDDKGRRTAVEVFDYETLELISPVFILSDYRDGKYLVYSYRRSVRFRVNQVRGPNAVLSGVFFNSRTNLLPKPPSRR